MTVAPQPLETYKSGDESRTVAITYLPDQRRARAEEQLGHRRFVESSELVIAREVLAEGVALGVASGRSGWHLVPKEAAVDLFVTFHSGEECIAVGEPLSYLCHLEEAMDVVVVPSDPRRVVVLVTRIPDAGGDLEVEHHHFLDERAPGMEHRHLTGNDILISVDVEVRCP